MTITVLQSAHDYHWSLDGIRHDPRSRGYRSRAEATQAAITACLARGEKIDAITGHADRKTCQAHQIRYLDPRRTRVTPGKRAKMDAEFGRKLLARGLKIENPRILAAEAAPVPAQPPSPPGPTPPSPPRSGRGAGGEVSNPLPEISQPLSPAKLAALHQARAKRGIARARKAPPGYGSVEHLLETVREHCGRRMGSIAALAKHLDVDESSVRRWLKREKIPLQRTLDSIALWHQSQTKKP